LSGNVTKDAGSQLVSILIPTYNQSPYLLQAAGSALKQDYAALEVVVCDDASPDWDRQLLKSLEADPRLRVHRNPANLGRVGNYRQALYELARGDWVLVLDGDDFLHDPAYVSRAMNIADSDSGIDLVFSNAARLHDDRGDTLAPPSENKGLPTVMAGPDLFLKLADKGVSLFHSTAIYKRQKAIDLDFYRRDIISSDWESLHRYILTGKVAFVDTIASVWRIHGGNATRNLSAQDRVRNLQVILEPYRAALKMGIFAVSTLDRWLDRLLWRTTFKDARTLLKAGDLDGYRSYLDAVKQISPRMARRLQRSPKLLARRLAVCLSHAAKPGNS
jgi:glycosyltransferase involved in cell wall biosynthesis